MNGKALRIFIPVVLLILFSATGASAQHYLGVRGGYGFGSSRLYPKEHKTSWLGGLATGGVSWKFYSPEKVLGGVEVDLLYIQQGFRYNIASDQVDDAHYQRKVNSVMLPLFWQPHVYLARQRLRIFVNAGVTFSYNIDQTYEYVYADSQGGRHSESGSYKMYMTTDNHWAYGLCAGGGFGWAIGKWEVVAEFRYYIGYSDLMKNVNRNPDVDPHEMGRSYKLLRSPLDKMEVNFGFYYRLGKGGIRSKPGPKMQKRMDEWEAQRALKRLARKGEAQEAEIPTVDEQSIDDDAVTEGGVVTFEGEIIETQKFLDEALPHAQADDTEPAAEETQP